MKTRILTIVACVFTVAIIALAGAAALKDEKEHGHDHAEDAHAGHADAHDHDAATKPSEDAHKHAEDSHGEHDHKHAEDEHDHKAKDEHKHAEQNADDHGQKHAKDEHDHGSKDEHKHAEDKHGHDRAGHDHAEQGHADEVKLTAEAIRRHGIRVAPVGKHALAASVVAPARVAYNAEAMAHVGSAVTGRAVEIKVRLGDAVEKGAELLIVESPELGEAQSDYLQKRTALAVAGAAVEPAKQSAERAGKLYEKNQGIALGELQKREAEHTAAQGAVQTAQAALEAAASKLRLMGMDDAAVEALAKTKQINPRSVVRAPIAGQVIERETTLGELVAPDKESLLVLANLATVWVIADVPEAKLADVRVGTPARVRVVTGYAPLDGKVSFIAPALDTSTRTAQVRVEVPNKSGSLKPGMFARADLAAGKADEDARVLAVPEEAVQTVEGRSCVFVPVEGEPNTFAAKPVKVGRPAGGMVPIESGLKEGEQVVVSGTFILKADLGKAGAAHEH